jgi:dTDP-D-glucose 4,6-dehydratase
VVGDQVKIVTTPTNDLRSYHISSEKIKRDIGFEPTHTIEDAVRDLKHAFEQGLVPDSLSGEKYFNVKLMQNMDLK